VEKFEEYEKIIMRGLCALKQIEYEKGKEEMEGSERGRRRIRREKTKAKNGGGEKKKPARRRHRIEGIKSKKQILMTFF
jgi:hypothetical protein